MIKGQSLKQLWESQGPVECSAMLMEGLRSGEFKPEDFSLRDLAESFCGHEWVRRLNTRYLERFEGVPVMEAGDGMDVSAFSNITGQILYTKIMAGWTQAVAAVEGLYTTIQTMFDGERLPWLGHVVQEGEVIHEGMPYPEGQFGERYIDTPHTDKYGLIVSITKEMIFFDRTSQATMRANEVGERLGYGKAKRLFQVIYGITNNYKMNGTSLNTYNASPNTNWVNKQGSTPLIDWTAIEQAYILASQILDPDTNNPIDIQFRQLLVQPAKLFTARRVLAATNVRTTTPGFATSGNPQQTTAPSPLPDALEVRTSALGYQQLVTTGGISTTNANDYWFIGDFAKAFAYMENWPITVVQAPPNTIKEFEQDIVTRVKGSERGNAAVIEPRQVMWFYNN